MEKQKILIISYVPTHPQDAGNKTRIYSMVKNLINLNKEVYFLYINRSNRQYRGNEKIYRRR